MEGWFTTSEPYALIGAKCTECGTYVFPPRSGACPNPTCDSMELAPVPLSRKGKVWSYTENHYARPRLMSPLIRSSPMHSLRLSSPRKASSFSARSPKV